ncbi:hypothetical protein E8K88_16470 [Lampropedia aestuarii]|uniref:Uncharacterized protein n=1 Tax=Lampropedia aestuarii TaxID=2562762 RepID=A0A4S5BG01_9BURK|nr:hypothetical protein [Lampropedia aestuarii]THJ30959.1 hypothetical protein E8K88_16470 [Lampropedia aestuarii]
MNETASTWTDKEVVTFQRRHKVFVAQGLKDGDAEQLAEQMLVRDRCGEFDMRVCQECANLIDKKCKNGRHRLFILHRCEMFEVRGKGR